jgi:AmiR/NasT family two-component response regulator
MTSALVFCAAERDAGRLAEELEGAGFHVLGAARRGELVREAVRHAPDVVVCVERRPDERLFAETAALQSNAPRPVIVFTDDASADRIERAVAAGVHAYVVDDGAPRRLRALVQLARSRFEHERALRTALEDATRALEERKWIDRAKGILMRARRLPEDEAWRALRSASMNDNRRVAEVAREVIDAADAAQALNRAGQLRMLSQRAVKLAALLAADAAPTRNRERLAQSVARGNDNLTLLAGRLAREGFRDLLDPLGAAWSALRAALAEPIEPGRLAALDALAEPVLAQAERLCAHLHARRGAAALRVVDLAGRQRMRSQRLAKQVLLASLLDDASLREAARETHAAFDAALLSLHALPLRNAEIARALQEADAAARELAAALPQAATLAGRCALGEASESALAAFERLVGEYESSMQLLVG